MRSFVTALTVALGSILALAAADAQSDGGFLGAQIAPLTPEVMARLGAAFGNGALITGTFPNSPAAQAGLTPDQVIVAADGQSVGSPKDLINIISGHAPGDTVSLLVVDTAHGYNSRTIDVTLAARPAGMETGSIPTNPEDQGIAQTAPAAPRTQPGGGLGAAGPIALQPLQGRFCRALAPDGWAIVDQDDRGSTITLASADQQMKAAYGIPGVSSGLVQGFYGPQYQTPDAYAQFLASILAGQQLQASGPQDFMGVRVLNFQGATDVGFAIYRVYPLIGDPGGYVLSARIAIAPSQQMEGIAGAVAATINCTTILAPPSGGYAQVQPRNDDVGTSSKCKAGACDDSDLAGTYNVQLGTGYVHSDTGQNYLVDPSTDYHDTGPDGPGYYRQVGNNVEKLVPGWSE